MDITFEIGLQKYRQEIQERLLSEVLSLEPATLYDSMRYALSAPGKLIRPTLLLLSCKAVNGNADDAIDAAIALEMIHTFTLVHDDIMDHDDLRRGRETIHKKWDESVAILAGDGLLVKAYGLLARLNPKWLPDILHRYSQGILHVCEGQALDKEFETRPVVSLPEYFHMIDNKTGRLFALACESGALLGGGTSQQIDNLRRFGASLGRSFQLQDDLLDLLGDEAVLGKDIGSDLQENKKTFLIICAYEMGTRGQIQQLNSLMGKRPIDPPKIAQIVALLKEIGALEKTKEEIHHNLQTARSSIENLSPTPAREQLFSLMEKIAHRNH